VFERFFRADPSRNRSLGGTGLGLSIVAALVAAHAGRVELETAPGRGATFRVLLPAAPDPELPDSDAPAEPAFSDES
jgi:two-component system, OmpR family, sensor kinase